MMAVQAVLLRRFMDGKSQEVKAMDILMLAVGFGFFALMFGFIRICERL